MPTGIYIRTKKPKRKVGWKLSEETKNKMSVAHRGNKSYKWKGSDVSYNGLHRWIRGSFGRPNYCEHCKKIDKKQYEWASINHTYTRERKDYIRLCQSCHIKYDKRFKIKNIKPSRSRLSIKNIVKIMQVNDFEPKKIK